MTKLEIFKMLFDQAFHPWPTTIHEEDKSWIIREQNRLIDVFYGIELIVTLCRATGCAYYIRLTSGRPEVRVYE